MNVLFIPTEVAGVNFYRVKQPMDAMKALYKKDDFGIIWYDPEMVIRDNWEYDLEGPSANERIQEISMAISWSDVVVWMGLHSPTSLRLFHGMRVRYPHKTFIMESDDYLLSSARCNKAAASTYKYGGELAKIGLEQMRGSDGVIVSTPTLKEFYEPFNKNIHVCENVVDLSLWRTKPHSHRQRVNFGWVGGGSHTDDLAHIKDSIFYILDKHPEAEFTILHGAPSFFKHKATCKNLNTTDPKYNMKVKCPECGGIDRLHWTHEFRTINKYPNWVSSYKFDVGLAPLVDINFTRGKSNLRWLEYSAMGIPTIASPLPHFTDAIKSGKTGIIVKGNSEKEWIEAMERMLNAPKERDTIGKNARAEVKSKWSPVVMAKKYRKAIGAIHHAKHEQGDSGYSDRSTNGRSKRHEILDLAETV